MGADPKPDYTIGHGYTEGAVTESDANRPELPDLFEMQGRMSGIVLQ